MKKIDYVGIGRRIAKQRNKMKMSQADLAERLGLTDGYISQIERGVSKVSLSRLNEIASVLETDIGLLVSANVTGAATKINRELCETIEDWPSDYVSLLIQIADAIDSKIKTLEN